MKKIFPGLLLSLLFPAMLAAENTEESPRKPLSDANITGHVQDAATGEHLPYITKAPPSGRRPTERDTIF